MIYTLLILKPVLWIKQSFILFWMNFYRPWFFMAEYMLTAYSRWFKRWIALCWLTTPSVSLTVSSRYTTHPWYRESGTISTNQLIRLPKSSISMDGVFGMADLFTMPTH